MKGRGTYHGGAAAAVVCGFLYVKTSSAKMYSRSSKVEALPSLGSTYGGKLCGQRRKEDQERIGRGILPYIHGQQPSPSTAFLVRSSHCHQTWKVLLGRYPPWRDSLVVLEAVLSMPLSFPPRLGCPAILTIVMPYCSSRHIVR